MVDASVAAKWFTDEPDRDAALEILDEAHTLHAPDFFLVEMDNLFGKWVRRRLVTHAEGDDLRRALRRFPLRYHDFGPLLDPAWEIAVGTGRSLYDCLYVALAAVLDGSVVTADRRLYEGLRNGPLGRNVVWVGDR